MEETKKDPIIIVVITFFLLGFGGFFMLIGYMPPGGRNIDGAIGIGIIFLALGLGAGLSAYLLGAFKKEKQVGQGLGNNI